MSPPFHKPGWYLFPLSNQSKKPIEGTNGIDMSSPDPAQWARWAEEFPGCNWGVDCGRSGLFVIDPDGEVGEATWSALELEHGISDTFEVRTPRGGRHLYYIGDGKSTVHKLGPKLDTRGEQGYVVLPGCSIPEGTYTLIQDRPLATAPTWAVEAAGATRDKVQGIEELDQPQNVARARSYLANEEPAIEGFGGDHHTFVVACTVLDLGVSEEKAFELMQPWNDRCDPPWDADDLKVKIENAATYRQNGLGAYALEESSQETFGAILGALPEEERQGQPRRKRLLRLSDMRNMPEPVWLVPEFLQERTIAIMYGDSQAFKTFLALDLSLSLASGIEAWGLPGGKATGVVYLAGEGPAGISRQRLPAWEFIHGMLDDDAPFLMTDRMVGPQIEDSMEEFIAEIEESGVRPKLLVIDTLFHFMVGLDESSVRDAGVAIKALEDLKTRLGCTILILHHTGKDKEKGLRGSSALFNGVDTVIKVEREKGTNFIAAWVQKQKDGKVPERPRAAELKEIAGSLVVQHMTAEEWRLRNRAVDYTEQDVREALQRIGKPVVAHVLAHELAPKTQDADPEQHTSLVNKIAAALEKDDRVKKYCFNGKWSAPAEPA